MASCDVSEPNGTKAKKREKTRVRVRRERGGSTKERLILAAIALSAQRGFSNVPLREVVERAECHNISAVHYHFKSRGGLLTAILQMIDRHWAVDVPAYAQRAGIFQILHAFILGLDDLKRASQWGNTVVKFLSRLAMDDDPETSAAATAFLSARLNAIYDAIAPYCAETEPAVLRLRVGNACLFLLTVSSHLDRSCMVALGCHNLMEIKENLVRETVAMAASIIQGGPHGEEEGVDVAPWPAEAPRHAVIELPVAHLAGLPEAGLPEQALA
ncbi:TetR/AcrR family transcriptional regulator [Pedomonas sp. V897]|uniref:TetR/AcrR family transcriptional regulator n=1 Tax=Pedomonas sp. V897 TaxID=3446482 RepID=UPI003EE3AF07